MPPEYKEPDRFRENFLQYLHDPKKRNSSSGFAAMKNSQTGKKMGENVISFHVAAKCSGSLEELTCNWVAMKYAIKRLICTLRKSMMTSHH